MYSSNSWTCGAEDAVSRQVQNAIWLPSAPSNTYPSTPGVAWLPATIRFAALLMNCGNSSMVSTLENDLRKGLIRSVRDAQSDVLHIETARDIRCFAGQLDGRAATLFADDFDVHPADAAAPAGTQRFHGGFFRGEAACITLVLVLEALAVFPLFRSVNASQESFAVPLDRALYAGHFGT